MRRTAIAMLTAALVLAHLATAQSAEHELEISVPEVLGIRLVGSDTGPRTVVFDYGSDPQAYLDAVASGGDLLPTLVQRFDDIEVRVVRNGRWSLHVVATPFAYVGTNNAGTLPLPNVRVDRGVRSGLIQGAIVGNGQGGGPGGGPGGGGGNPNAGNFGYAATWSLSDTAQEIAWRTGGTGGWRSLGFCGLDYALTVDGSEASGRYTTTVTYFLTFP